MGRAGGWGGGGWGERATTGETHSVYFVLNKFLFKPDSFGDACCYLFPSP